VSPIKPGEPWERPADDQPDLEVAGNDAALAAAVAAVPGALVRFRPAPESDLALAVGLRSGVGWKPPAAELALDVLRLPDGLACNVVVAGTAPDRLVWGTTEATIEVAVDGEPWFAGHATTVVVANGQFLRGADLAPRGHPGDGRAEVQVYALRRGERRAMRGRLATGTHVPHPRIRTRTGRVIEIRSPRPVALEVDGESRPALSVLRVDVVPAAYRLLV